MSDEPRYDINELAALAGVNRRTVRFYVQRGLLPQPLGTGRGAHYDQAHLARLIEVRTQQESGLSLDQIAAPDAPITPVAPSRQRSAAPARPLTAWQRVAVADGIELHVRADQIALAPDLLIRLLAAVAADVPKEDEPHA